MSIPTALKNAVSMILLWTLAACGAQNKPGGAQGGRVFPPELLEGTTNAPEFPAGLDWLNTSTPLRLKDLRGKFVLLDFWTYCCINCMHILPDLAKLEQKYAQELVVIGVHSAKFKNEKDTSQIRSAILRYGIHHPVVNDASFQVWQSYGVNSWPTVVLINPLGKVVAERAGESVFEPFDAVLQQAVPHFAAKGELKRSPLQLSLEEARRANTLLEFPGKISSDQQTNRLYITDSNHNRILVADAAGRILDVIGTGDQGRDDGSFEQARFHHPQGTFASGDVLYIADTENHLVRVADLRARVVKTVLGTGQQAKGFNQPGRGTSVALNSPWDLLVRAGKMYIAMAGFHQLWVADLKTWEARPFAGSGREDIQDNGLLDAALAQPSGITTDGHELYFADSETSSIRQAGLAAGGRVRTILGKGLFDFGDIDGDASKARLQHPLGVAYSDGLLYVADTYNSRIKVVDPASRTVRTLAGNGMKTLADGKFASAAFNEPGGLAWLGGKLYVADTNNHQIRVLDPSAKTVATLEFTGLEKLSRREMDSFRGRLLDLGQRELKTGAGKLALNIVLPAGYKFNREAPFYMRWKSADGSRLKFGLQADKVDFRKVGFPLQLPVELPAGRSELTIDSVVYYCTENSTACLVDPIRVKLALQASPGAPAGAPVDIPVRKPNL
jgi:DNA-binding beta-propeller fold protein YncE